jgi:hypothetical protein
MKCCATILKKIAIMCLKLWLSFLHSWCQFCFMTSISCQFTDQVGLSCVRIYVWKLASRTPSAVFPSPSMQTPELYFVSHYVIHQLSYCHVFMAPWLIITRFGLHDWIYWQLLLQSLVITINYKNAESVFSRTLLPWLPRSRPPLVLF